MALSNLPSFTWPKYEHDCAHCVSLGGFRGQDLYFCPRHGSAIARFGNSGEEYESMPTWIMGQLIAQGVDTNTPVFRAYRRARVFGLL
jgi:hypothetical protein